MWPGFGENLRVLEWIMDRCMNTAGSRRTAIGYIPKSQDLDLAGLGIPDATMQKLLSIDKNDWLEEVKDIETFFKTFGSAMPQEMFNQLEGLAERLKQ
jgi:phosphoenolpyruvate carboxykinase (GTP)